MNVLSCFDGMSCGQLALNKLGVKIDNYFASEIKPHAIKVTQSNFPNTIQLGDITKVNGHSLPKIDLLLAGSPCFVANTKVLTIEGYKNIQDVVIGDLVLSHTGNWRKVLNVGGTIAPTRIIKGMGNIGLETTDEHPFYTREVHKEWDNQNRKYNRKFTMPCWKSAINLNKKTYCSMVTFNTNENIEDNYNFWYMIGRYTGDGWYIKTKRLGRKNSYFYKFIVCCGKHEVEYLKNKFDLFGYKYNCYKERTAYKFIVYSQELVEYVKIIGKGASNKIIHPDLYQQSKYNIKAFLDGYFDSDGSSIGNLQKASSISYQLILGIQQLVLAVYRQPCRLYIHIPKPYTIIENRVVNQSTIYSVVFKKSKNKQDKAFYDDIYAWLPVKSNIITNETKPVYNIEVEIDNSYTANNIVVHNCKDLSAANRTRDGLEGEKSGLFYEFVRLLKETNPTYFLLENVRMDKKWEDEISNILGVKPIIIDSALVTGAFRKRLYWTNIPQYDTIDDCHVNLQELLDSGYTDRNKARCLLESDSRPSATPVKMFHRYYGTGFTTLIFKDEQHYYDCKNHYDSNYKGLAAKDILCDSNVYDGVRYLTKTERERLQTVPVNYCKDLTENEAASLLGDGWTVDVIAHLLKNMESK